MKGVIRGKFIFVNAHIRQTKWNKLTRNAMVNKKQTFKWTDGYNKPGLMKLSHVLHNLVHRYFWLDLGHLRPFQWMPNLEPLLQSLDNITDGLLTQSEEQICPGGGDHGHWTCKLGKEEWKIHLWNFHPPDWFILHRHYLFSDSMRSFWQPNV